MLRPSSAAVLDNPDIDAILGQFGQGPLLAVVISLEESGARSILDKSDNLDIDTISGHLGQSTLSAAVISLEGCSIAYISVHIA
jgi:hypothetical protein